MAICARVLRRRLSVVSTLIAAALLASCGGFDDVGDLFALADALNAEYQAPIDVKLNNGRHLVLTFQNAAAAKLATAERETFARRVAEFARVKYPKAGDLTDISVGFSDISGLGPLRIERTNVPYRWTVAELASTSTPADTVTVR